MQHPSISGNGYDWNVFSENSNRAASRKEALHETRSQGTQIDCTIPRHWSIRQTGSIGYSFLIFLSLGCYVIPTRYSGLQNWFRLIQKIQNVLTLHLFTCILVCTSKCIYKVFALLSHSVFLQKKKEKR